MESRRERKRTLAIVLAFTSAIGLAVGALGPSWITSPTGPRMMIGLRGFTVCLGGTCASVSNFQMIDELDKRIADLKSRAKDLSPMEQRDIPRDPWHGFPVVAWIALVTALLAALGLVWGAVLALQRKRPELPIMPTTLAVMGLALAIISGCLVLATKPDVFDDIALGWSFWVFGVGAVLGLAAVFPLNRQIRPIDEELGAASATTSWGVSRDDD